MEQGGISIMSPPGVVENSGGKSRSIGITLSSNGSVQSAKEKMAPWMKKLVKVDTTLWDTFLVALAELIGTAILLFVGCMGCVGTMGDQPPSSLQIALTFGFAVMVAIQCVGHISGAHINPSVTVAAVIVGNMSFLTAVVYVVAQCLGGLIGYGLLKMITPGPLLSENKVTNGSFCITHMVDDTDFTDVHGVAAEIMATGILIFFICAAWDPRNANNVDSLSIKFGLCITVLCFAAGPYTGCSMNPARSFAPVVWNGEQKHWEKHWIYWVGPLLGAFIAASLYRCVFLHKTKRKDSKQDANGTLNGIET